MLVVTNLPLIVSISFKRRDGIYFDDGGLCVFAPLLLSENCCFRLIMPDASAASVYMIEGAVVKYPRA